MSIMKISTDNITGNNPFCDPIDLICNFSFPNIKSSTNSLCKFSAYLNISEEAAKLCRNLQKVILRELKGYQMDNNCSEMRFMDVISKLSLFERGEKRLQEEIVICDVIDISLDEDFKTIMHIKKL